MGCKVVLCPSSHDLRRAIDKQDDALRVCGERSEVNVLDKKGRRSLFLQLQKAWSSVLGSKLLPDEEKALYSEA